MRNSVIKRIFAYLKPQLIRIIIAFLCAAIGTALALYIPVLIGKAVDFIIDINNVDFDGILKTVINIAVCLVLSAVFNRVFTLLTNTITYHTVKKIRIDIFSKINLLPLKYIDKTPHGDIANRLVNDADFVADGLLQGITQLFTGVFTILGTLVFMLRINPLIAMVVVFITPLSIFVSAFISKLIHNTFKAQTNAQGELSGFVSETFSNYNVVKAFSLEENVQQKFEKINARLYTLGQKAQFYSSLSNPSTRFVNGIVYAAVGIIGALSVLGGNLSVGQLTSFLAYANQYTKPFNEVTGILTQLQTAFSAASRLFEILDEKQEYSENEKDINFINGTVSMEDVSFSYSKTKPLIENLNLKVNPGEKIAIVGPTGSGKTTLINLLMRFYEACSGEIMVDGQNIKNIKKDSLRRHFGMVLQETWLFHGTIRENIAFGKPNATEDEIINAAKSAHAHSFIKKLKDGYDTVISGDGSNISAGQRQLLCISRVMLIDPPMLILDEATSNIDTMTEIRVQKAFDKMMQGRTSFIVAHRLSTIREADRVLVINGGNITEQGTHDELLEKGGFYKELYESQFAAN